MSRVGAAALAAVLLLLASACGTVPGQPSPADWRSTARQSLQTAASEVATVQMVLEEAQDEQLLGRYGAVSVTNAESALGSAQDSILTLQPPATLQQQFDAVATVLGDAGDLVTQSRIAIVRDDRTQYAELVDRLDAMTGRLETLRTSLGGGR